MDIKKAIALETELRVTGEEKAANKIADFSKKSQKANQDAIDAVSKLVDAIVAGDKKAEASAERAFNAATEKSKRINESFEAFISKSAPAQKAIKDLGITENLEKPAGKAGEALKGVAGLLSKAGEALGPFGTGLSKVGGLLGELGAAAGPVAALVVAVPALAAGLTAVVSKLFDFSKGAAESKKATDELTRLTGVANDLAVALQTAGSALADPASLGDLKDGIVQLKQAQKEILAGNAEIAESFGAIGGKNLTDANVSLQEIASRVQSLGKDANNLGVEFGRIFGEEGGRQFREILQNLDEARVKSAQFGLIIDEKIGAQLTSLTKKLNDISLQFKGLETIAGGRFAESFTVVATAFSDAIEKFRNNDGAVAGLENIANLLEKIITGPLPGFIGLLSDGASFLAKFGGFLAAATVGTNEFEEAVKRLPRPIDAVAASVEGLGKAALTGDQRLKVIEATLKRISDRNAIDAEGRAAAIISAIARIDAAEQAGTLTAQKAAAERSRLAVQEAENKKDAAEAELQSLRIRLAEGIKDQRRALNEVAQAEAPILKEKARLQGELDKEIRRIEGDRNQYLTRLLCFE